jgi:hypothetical protein
MELAIVSMTNQLKAFSRRAKAEINNATIIAKKARNSKIF